jgi:hypothetical protein
MIVPAAKVCSNATRCLQLTSKNEGVWFNGKCQLTEHLRGCGSKTSTPCLKLLSMNWKGGWFRVGGLSRAEAGATGQITCSP